MSGDNEAMVDPDFWLHEDRDNIVLTPKSATTRRHGRYDLSTPAGMAKARAFLDTCTDSDASICFTCRGRPIGEAMAELAQPPTENAPMPPERDVLAKADRFLWLLAILALAALGAAMFKGAVLGFLNVFNP